MLLGAFINGLAIIIGSLCGVFFKGIKEDTKETVTIGIGLGVIALGVQMTLNTESFITMLICLCIGAIAGEKMGVERKMHQVGEYIEERFAKDDSNFAEGFVTATLIFMIGSMGIIGAIESGVAHNHNTLYTKAVMDGFLAIMLTASIGISVVFSAFPVFLYEGAIALIAGLLLRNLPGELLDSVMVEISAIGGVMMMGIGLNLLKITKIRVSNFLPGVIFLLIWLSINYYFL